MDSITENLRNLRGRAGKTQIQVADEMQISRSTYCSYENGITPPVTALVTIAKYYKVSVDYLLGLTKEKNLNAINDLGRSFERLSKLAGDHALLPSDVSELIDSMIKYYRAGAKAEHAPADTLRDIMDSMTSLFTYAAGEDMAAVLSAVNDVTRHTLSVTGILNAFLTNTKTE